MVRVLTDQGRGLRREGREKEIDRERREEREEKRRGR